MHSYLATLHDEGELGVDTLTSLLGGGSGSSRGSNFLLGGHFI